MTDGRVPGVTPPSRTNRSEHRRRSRRAEAIVTIAAVVLAGLYAWTKTGADPAPGPRSSGSSVSVSPHVTAAADLAVLSITGGSGPMILILGKAGGPVAISLPQRLTLVVPGMGETGVDVLGQLDGPAVRVGVSNMLGVWVRHYGVASVKSIAKAVARAGGLRVDLGRAFTAKGTTIGPGPATLTGAQLTAYLSGPKTQAVSRWGVLATAMLTERFPLPPGAFIETDDAAAVSRLLAAVRGTRATTLPVTDVGGVVQAPDLPAIDTMASAWGSSHPPVPVIVQNGNGVPGVGAVVAERLIPAGFRVVLSTNATSFSVRRTTITALGADMAGAARRARHVLGLGMVRVSSVPSGVGEVKIIVGKDFK